MSSELSNLTREFLKKPGILWNSTAVFPRDQWLFSSLPSNSRFKARSVAGITARNGTICAPIKMLAEQPTSPISRPDSRSIQIRDNAKTGRPARNQNRPLYVCAKSQAFWLRIERVLR